MRTASLVRGSDSRAPPFALANRGLAPCGRRTAVPCRRYLATDGEHLTGLSYPVGKLQFELGT